MIHELMISPEWFEDIIQQKKTFEIRKNDRNYSVGDTLILREIDKGKYTGREVKRTVSYITSYGDGIYGLSDEYVVMAIEPLEKQKTGHWVKVNPLQADDEGAYMCSCCKFGNWVLNVTENYCPNCGAKMQEVEE